MAVVMLWEGPHCGTGAFPEPAAGALQSVYPKMTVLCSKASVV